jgi:hypothetical protein
MKTRIKALIFALVLSSLGLAARTQIDSLVIVSGTDLKFLFGDTLNLSFELDATTRTILPGTISIAFSGPVSVPPFVFTLAVWPSFNNNALFDFEDAASSELDVGVNDFGNAQFPDITFPAVGDYSYTLDHLGSVVSVTCAPSDSACSDGLAVGPA